MSNKQQEFEQAEYIKKIMWQFHDDVLNDNLPDITFTPLCESIYLRAAIIGAGIATENAIGIMAPTLNRYAGTGIADETNFEQLN
jgi:hypothetical protein